MSVIQSGEARVESRSRPTSSNGNAVAERSWMRLALMCWRDPCSDTTRDDKLAGNSTSDGGHMKKQALAQ